MSAWEQLDAIDRYLSKNWLDDDYPTNLIYEALDELANYKQTLKVLTLEGGYIP